MNVGLVLFVCGLVWVFFSRTPFFTLVPQEACPCHLCTELYREKVSDSAGEIFSLLKVMAKYQPI